MIFKTEIYCTFYYIPEPLTQKQIDFYFGLYKRLVDLFTKNQLENEYRRTIRRRRN